MTLTLPCPEGSVALLDIARGRAPDDPALAQTLEALAASDGCRGSALYAGVDDDKTLVYAQWSTAEAAGAAFAAQGPALAAGGAPGPWRARLYRLDSAADRGPVDLAGPKAGIAHTGLFAMRDPARQGEMLDRGRTAARASIDGVEALTGAFFHGALDGTTVINFGFWDSEAGFRALAADPPFANRYWADLADNEPGLYRRARVLAG